MLGLVGRKKGMTRVFTKEGVSIPVTLIEVEPNRITQIKTVAREQYDAVQVTTGFQKRHRVNKPTIGHYAKAEVELGRGLWEFRISSEELDWIVKQKNLDLALLKSTKKVDVTGTSKGKGFAGVMKRWNFSGQGASHGNSLSHRAPGSIGQNQTPGRVFPGKKMAGHLGNEKVTIQGLEIVRVDAARHLLLVKGAVPGPIGGDVIIKPSIKSEGLQIQGMAS